MAEDKTYGVERRELEQLRAKQAGAKKCDEPGCDKPVKARGKCSTCYLKARKNGRLPLVRHQRKAKRTEPTTPAAAAPRQRSAPPVDGWFEARLREVAALADQGIMAVIELDGRKYTLLEVDLVIKGGQPHA